jgi:murein endopeptidase
VPFATVLAILSIAVAPAPAALSRATGQPWAGRLVHGRQLPAVGAGYATWDPIRKRVGNRGWRRWGTERLLTTVRGVLTRYARAHPGATPVLVGDLSRPHGGDFGKRFGGLGHVSHQNGLDADVYYPRRDGRLLRAARPEEVDRAAAQELVDGFVRGGAEHVFVGPSLGLRGPPEVVQELPHHDDHMHVRLRG